jgi:hypothetical protein
VQAVFGGVDDIDAGGVERKNEAGGGRAVIAAGKVFYGGSPINTSRRKTLVEVDAATEAGEGTLVTMASKIFEWEEIFIGVLAIWKVLKGDGAHEVENLLAFDHGQGTDEIGALVGVGGLEGGDDQVCMLARAQRARDPEKVAVVVFDGTDFWRVLQTVDELLIGERFQDRIEVVGLRGILSGAEGGEKKHGDDEEPHTNEENVAQVEAEGRVPCEAGGTVGYRGAFRLRLCSGTPEHNPRSG